MSYLVRMLSTVLVAGIHMALYPSLVPRPFLSEDTKLLVPRHCPARSSFSLPDHALVRDR